MFDDFAIGVVDCWRSESAESQTEMQHPRQNSVGDERSRTSGSHGRVRKWNRRVHHDSHQSGSLIPGDSAQPSHSEPTTGDQRDDTERLHESHLAQSHDAGETEKNESGRLSGGGTESPVPPPRQIRTDEIDGRVGNMEHLADRTDTFGDDAPCPEKQEHDEKPPDRESER